MKLNTRVSVTAAVAAAALTFTGIGIAEAQTNSPRCDTATALTVKAKATMTTAWDAVVARGKELGATDADITKAQSILESDADDAVRQQQLVDLYNSSGIADGKATVADLALVYKVVDTRLALEAAIAAQNVECASSAATTTPAPDVTEDDDPQAGTGDTVDIVVPDTAPATGDGSTA